MDKSIPLERTITDGIMRYLRTLEPRGWFFKAHGSAFQVAGVPDIIGVYSGRFIALEVKRPKLGRATALQMAILRRITDAGGVAAIVYGVDDVRRVLSEVKE